MSVLEKKKDEKVTFFNWTDKKFPCRTVLNGDPFLFKSQTVHNNPFLEQKHRNVWNGWILKEYRNQ